MTHLPSRDWLKQQIAGIEAARDDIPFGLDENGINQLAAYKTALSVLDAEPVAWTDEQELRDVERDGCGYLYTVNPITPHADPRRIIKLYTAPDEFDDISEGIDADASGLRAGNSPVIPDC